MLPPFGGHQTPRFDFCSCLYFAPYPIEASHMMVTSVSCCAGGISPPWEPTVYGSLDTSQFDKEFTSMPIFSPDVKDSRFGMSQDNMFEGFTFTDDSMQMMSAGMQKMRGGR